MGHYQLQSFSEIELYRGGNSTLFGSGAISGAINAVMTSGGAFGLWQPH